MIRFCQAAAVAVLSLATTPCVATATALSEQEVSEMIRVLGWEGIPDIVADVAIAAEPEFSIPGRAACARPLMLASFRRSVERSVRAAIPDRESAEAWRRFAATRGGSKFLAMNRAEMEAHFKGGDAEAVERLRAGIDELERADVAAFKATAVGARGNPHLLHMDPEEGAALARAIDGKCGTKQQTGQRD